MGHPHLAALALLAVLAGAWPAGAPAGQAGSCRLPRHRQARLRGPRVLVWKVYEPSRESRDGEEVPALTRYFACARPDGRTRVIVSATISLNGGGEVRAITASGTFVAAATIFGVEVGGDEDVLVRNAASGRGYEVTVLEYINANNPHLRATDLERLGKPVGVGVSDLTIDSRGDAAWVGRTVPHKGESVLYVHGPSGLRRVAIEPAIEDLRFAGASLRWRSAGVERSAPLSPESAPRP